MKKITLTLLLFSSMSVFAQKEASNWFFGFFAGIHFNEDGTVVPLPGGQTATNEGCSVISDADGNLLFYTDGRNVWDRNHVKMPNGNYNAGTGLMGDPSSSQSGIIVPKKGDPNVYYIFTVDEPHHENAAVYPNVFSGPYADNSIIPDADDGFNNGLNYSVVDLSVTGTNGSIGDVVTRNVHLVTYDPSNINEAKYRCSEKITAVKNNTGTGFWVVTQFIDKFYAFAVNETGVSTTPVITQIAPVVSQAGYRRNAIGYLKASPNGRKLAIAHQQRGNLAGGTQQNGAVYLYNFDNSNGVVSNAVMLSQNTIPYGIEFSPQSKKLYVSYDVNNAGYGGIHQYNLQSADIPASDVFIANATSTALQLGPNGKIYHAINGGTSLNVIHLPDEDGLACDFEPQGVFLGGGMTSVFGLPPFITSLFSANIQAENTCLGDTTQFSVSAIGDFQAIDWDFGDNAPHSSELAPVHTYTSPGQYTVVAVITNDGDVYTVSTELTIYGIPAANTAPAINECDPENNGTEIFDLTARTAAILGGQPAANMEVRYFDSQANADANSNTINATSFTNTSNPQTIYARVHQRGNNNCFATTSFEIRAVQAPVPSTFVTAICDDATDGNDTNGRATFNLSMAASNMLQNSADYTITWHASEENANSMLSSLAVSFYNTTPNEQIVYMRVQNNTYTNCVTVFPITLKVNPLIPQMAGTTLVQCPNPDGPNIFNLTQADNMLTNGDAALAVTYYKSQADAENNIDPITGAFENTSNPQVVAARVAYTATGCYRIVPVTLEVTTTVLPVIPFEQCDNDGTEDGFTAFDLTTLGLESPTNEVTYYTSLNDALMEQNPVPSAFTNTIENTQHIFARVENNNECAALQEIQLIVRPLPDIDIDDEAIVCLNTREEIAIDAGILPNHTNYHFLWSTGETTHTIFVNTPGTYTVEVTNISNVSQCSKTRTIVVNASDVAVFDDIVVEDLRKNNTITVIVHPGNNVATTYRYSLDQPNGPWQESNYFENVSPGIHTVYVYDMQGCGISKRDVPVLGIPNFFTPNGDGVNDTWNIIGINALFYNHSKIYIFDRYGKLLADVDPRGLGWDGTNNGRPLPSTDYWYVLQLDNGRTVKGHFSMVR